MVGLNKHISAMPPKRNGKQIVIDMTQQPEDSTVVAAAVPDKSAEESAAAQSNGNAAQPVRRKLGMDRSNSGVSEQAREAARAAIEATVVQRPQVSRPESLRFVVFIQVNTLCLCSSH